MQRQLRQRQRLNLGGQVETSGPRHPEIKGLRFRV